MARRQRRTDSTENDCSTGTSQGNASHTSAGARATARPDAAAVTRVAGDHSMAMTTAVQSLSDMIDPVFPDAAITRDPAYKFERDRHFGILAVAARH